MMSSLRTSCSCSLIRAIFSSGLRSDILKPVPTSADRGWCAGFGGVRNAKRCRSNGRRPSCTGLRCQDRRFWPKSHPNSEGSSQSEKCFMYAWHSATKFSFCPSQGYANQRARVFRDWNKQTQLTSKKCWQRPTQPQHAHSARSALADETNSWFTNPQANKLSIPHWLPAGRVVLRPPPPTRRFLPARRLLNRTSWHTLGLKPLKDGELPENREDRGG